MVMILGYISCKEEYPLLKEESREQFSTLRFSNFHRIQYKGIGKMKWELHSEEAYIYQNKKTQEINRIIVYHFSFQQYLPSKISLKAQKAVIDYKINQISLRGNAQFVDPENQMKIFSEELLYNLKSGIVNTKKSVSIYRKNHITRCLKGLYYDKQKGIQICRRPSGTVIQSPQTKKPTKTQTPKEEFFF